MRIAERLVPVLERAFFWFTLRVFREHLSVCVCASFLSSEDGMRNLL